MGQIKVRNTIQRYGVDEKIGVLRVNTATATLFNIPLLLVCMKEQLNPGSGSQRRGSAGTSPSPSDEAAQIRLPTSNMLTLEQCRRQRSCSDLYSQQQPHSSGKSDTSLETLFSLITGTFS